MRYSYTTPRKKSAITQEIKLLIIFFGMTLLMLSVTYIFLLYKDYTFMSDKQSVITLRNTYDTEIQKMKKQIHYIEKQDMFSQKIYTQNTVLKDSITNLFDLVPDRITLSKATLMKNGLIMYGITPNKDVYNFMLQAPLRSIFHKTYSSFYPAKNGWLHFVSTNYVDTTLEDETKEDANENEN